ncbi:hypothetical protein NM208_g1544 [Fusarium decemcellulare]|uniref:Uncharacterized protein n=1 Tax=Fusarium decemcellulare TaxID=57161 RepID=A0ACC1SVU3_9HYPO|nr:hypothetical protein NM208_g1544 [Fusarium decemcellulare]
MAPEIIYNPAVDYGLPDIDLLSLLFESPECPTEEDTLLHIEASNVENAITKAQTRFYTKFIAQILRSRFGIGAQGPGKDVVVCISSGQILLPPLFYAVIAAGGVYSAASSSFTKKELARQINHGNAVLLVASPDCAHVAHEAAGLSGLSADRIIILNSSEGDRSLIDQARNNLLASAEKYGQDLLDWEVVTDPETLRTRPICLLYSSGTTGEPKGMSFFCVHMSHLNLVSSGLITGYRHHDWKRRQRAKDANFNFQYRTIGHLPAAHIAGILGYLVHPSMYGPGTVYWMPKFNFDDFLKYNKKHRITSFFTVPPIYMLIAHSPKVTDQFEALHHAITGAAPMGPDLTARAEKKLGCTVSQTWGLSETTASVTGQPWDEPDSTGSISTILPNIRMRIVDDAGRDVQDGQQGEFLVQGPTVTVGYWNDAEATARTFTSCGRWLKTGDEMIKYKGLQVAPAELEATLVSHPLIHDAAVIGVPDPSLAGNEVPRAFVVADSTRVSAKDIQTFIKNELAPQKQLRGGVVFLKQIPKSATGKILRKVLRDQSKEMNEAAKL